MKLNEKQWGLKWWQHSTMMWTNLFMVPYVIELQSELVKLNNELNRKRIKKKYDEWTCLFQLNSHAFFSNFQWLYSWKISLSRDIAVVVNHFYDFLSINNLHRCKFFKFTEKSSNCQWKWLVMEKAFIVTMDSQFTRLMNSQMKSKQTNNERKQAEKRRLYWKM